MALPPPLPGLNIPRNVSSTYDTISQKVLRGQALLAEEEVDFLRIKMVADDIEESIDVLDTLMRIDVPDDWFDQLCIAMDKVITDLRAMADNIMNDDE